MTIQVIDFGLIFLIRALKYCIIYDYSSNRFWFDISSKMVSSDSQTDSSSLNLFFTLSSALFSSLLSFSLLQITT